MKCLLSLIICLQLSTLTLQPVFADKYEKGKRYQSEGATAQIFSLGLAISRLAALTMSKGYTCPSFYVTGASGVVQVGGLIATLIMQSKSQKEIYKRIQELEKKKMMESSNVQKEQYQARIDMEKKKIKAVDMRTGFDTAALVLESASLVLAILENVPSPYGIQCQNGTGPNKKTKTAMVMSVVSTLFLVVPKLLKTSSWQSYHSEQLYSGLNFERQSDFTILAKRIMRLLSPISLSYANMIANQNPTEELTTDTGNVTNNDSTEDSPRRVGSSLLAIAGLADTLLSLLKGKEDINTNVPDWSNNLDGFGDDIGNFDLDPKSISGPEMPNFNVDNSDTSDLPGGDNPQGCFSNNFNMDVDCGCLSSNSCGKIEFNGMPSNIAKALKPFGDDVNAMLKGDYASAGNLNPNSNMKAAIAFQKAARKAIDLHNKHSKQKLDFDKLLADAEKKRAQTLGTMGDMSGSGSGALLAAMTPPQKEESESTKASEKMVISEGGGEAGTSEERAGKSDGEFELDFGLGENMDGVSEGNVMAAGEDFGDYEINYNDINQADTTPIWKIISIRYLESGYPKLLQEN